jgi:hypothetical protein
MTMGVCCARCSMRESRSVRNSRGPLPFCQTRSDAYVRQQRFEACHGQIHGAGATLYLHAHGPYGDRNRCHAISNVGNCIHDQPQRLPARQRLVVSASKPSRNNRPRCPPGHPPPKSASRVRAGAGHLLHDRSIKRSHWPSPHPSADVEGRGATFRGQVSGLTCPANEGFGF